MIFRNQKKREKDQNLSVCLLGVWWFTDWEAFREKKAGAYKKSAVRVPTTRKSRYALICPLTRLCLAFKCQDEMEISPYFTPLVNQKFNLAVKNFGKLTVTHRKKISADILGHFSLPKTADKFCNLIIYWKICTLQFFPPWWSISDTREKTSLLKYV